MSRQTDARHLDGPLDADGTAEPPLDPTESAAVIAAQRERLAAATDVDGRLLFGVWGVAWLLGFGALYAVAGDPPLLPWPPAAAGFTFAALLVAAMVVTAVHIALRSAGVRGTSATQGAMYGWAWFLGFAGVGALGYALTASGADADLMTTAMTIVPALLTGTLYLAGAAIWQDRTQFALGAWIVAVTIVAAVVGTPGMLAVMSVAGGGGMLLGGLAEQARRRGATGGRPRPRRAVEP